MNILYHHRTRGQEVERVHIMGVVKALRQLGHQVTIVSPPGANPDKPSSNVQFAHAKKRTGWNFVSRYVPEFLFEFLEICYNLYAYVQMKSVMKNHKIAFIYERYALFGFAGVLLAKRYKTPILLEINDATFVERVRKLKCRRLAAKIERWVFSKASGLITISSAFKKMIVNVTSIPDANIWVAPNAINPDNFNLHQTDGQSVRARYRLNDEVVIGYVGGFVHWHRVDYLVEVIARLIPQYPNIRCFLIGDGVSRASLEEYITQENINHYFVFTGRLPHEQVPKYIAAMDIAVIPDSNKYGSPVKLFEYMAMGKAVVAPRLAPMEDVLTEGIDGMLFEPKNKEQLKKLLAALIEDSEKRVWLGQNARRTVYKKHLWVHNAQQIIDIYLNIQYQSGAGKR